MSHHTCLTCQRGFIATSYDEAMDALEKIAEADNEVRKMLEEKTKDDVVKLLADENRLAYARYCPYCGSTTVEAR